MKRRIIWSAVVIFLLLLIVLVVWTLWGNANPVLTCYTVNHEALPASFEGFRIAQISDLHNDSFGENNSKLLALLEEGQPDIIVITGDLIDSRRTNTEVALNFVEEIVKIAPVYYVTGNHEFRRPEEFGVLEKGMADLGVILLRNKGVNIEKDGESICIVGIDDMTYHGNDLIFCDNLEKLCDREEFTVLLSHHPVFAETYAKVGAEITFCGHAHGGQIRLPLIGGIYGPDQGIFPKYDSGVYEIENSKIVVSRGIGNSIFPIRFNNRPEIVLAELHSTENE